MDFIPRLKTIHTSYKNKHQIYIPAANWTLCAGCIFLLIIFQSSADLGSVYGFAVSGVMLITSLAFIPLYAKIWRWGWFKAAALFGVFALIDASFLTANTLKFFEGAFVPLGIGLLIFAAMKIWKKYRDLIRDSFERYSSQRRLDWFIKLKARLERSGVIFEEDETIKESDRAIIFLVSKAVHDPGDPMPIILRKFIEWHGYVPKWVFFLTIKQPPTPFVRGNRYFANKLCEHVYGIRILFGFMEKPDIRKALIEMQKQFGIDLSKPHIEVGEIKIKINPEISALQLFEAKIFRAMVKHSAAICEHLGIEENIQPESTTIIVTRTREGMLI